MSTVYTWCAAACAAATVAAGVAHLIIRPARRRRKNEQALRQALRDQVIRDLQQQHADKLAAQVQHERTRVIRLTVESLYDGHPDLWDRFVEGHGEPQEGVS